MTNEHIAVVTGAYSYTGAAVARSLMQRGYTVRTLTNRSVPIGQPGATLETHRLQFADFASCPFDMIVTVAAKTHWRSGLAVPIVIRAPNGGGIRGGPFHASSPEGWFVGERYSNVQAPNTKRVRVTVCRLVVPFRLPIPRAA